MRSGESSERRRAFGFLIRGDAVMLILWAPSTRLNVSHPHRSDAVQRYSNRTNPMNRFRILLLAGLIAAAPMAEAVAQNRERPSRAEPRGPSGDQLMSTFRQERAREESQEGRRVSASEVSRNVARGREGRMLGINERNMGGRPGYVVRWEYPGGRIADIRVDARSGAVIGER